MGGNDGVWAPGRRRLTVGLVVTITLFASEALAIATVMPDVARDLGRAGYGAAFSSFFLGSVVGALVGGPAADRYGPAPPLLAAGLLFAVGLLGGGGASAMWVLVAARALQGVGAGTSAPVSYAAIGRAYPEAARIRMFTVASTAWVVPGVVGPGLAGAVAGWFGWRWVFWGLLPLVVVALVATVPPLLRLGRVPGAETEALPSPVVAAVGLAGAVGLALAALERHSLLGGVAFGAAAVVVGFWPALLLLPAGLFRLRRGVPASVLTRGLLAWSFTGVDAFVPLSITAVRGRSVLFASVAVTLVPLVWTAGSWAADRSLERRGAPWLVRRGLLILVAGVALQGLFLVLRVPLLVGLVGTGVAGFGIGLAYSPLSATVLSLARQGEEGRASSSLTLFENLGFAIGPGVTGALVAFAERGRFSLVTALGAGWAICGAMGVAGSLLAGRLTA